MSLLDQKIHFLLNSHECLSQGTGDRQVGIEGGESRSEDRAVQAGEEQSDFAAIGRNAVAMGMRNPPDHTLEAQTPQVIGELMGRVR